MAEAHFRLAGGVIGQRAGQDQRLLHGHGGDRHRRHLCGAAGAGSAAGRHRLHHRLRAAGRDLGARADPGARSPAASATERRNRRSATRPRSSACWSASRCSRIAIVVILDNLGVNVTALVAGLGIGGIAIGLAAQGIFSDLFAALVDPVRQAVPPRRHDPLRHQHVGTVERIGLKTTRLRRSDRRAGDHGQHQAARAARSTTSPRPGRGATSAVRPDLPDAAGNAGAAAGDRRGGGRSASSGCKLVRCVVDRLRRRARSTASWFMTTAAIDPTRWRRPAPRSSSALLRDLRARRRSSSPIRPRPPSPPRPTARWSCPRRRLRRNSLP